MSTSSLSKENLKKVAVIGCGVGGLGAAWLVNRHPNYHVTLYEKETRLGGHANTVIVNGLPIDTGFLVYNENTYPNLIGLFEELGVPTEPSDMSFAVSLADRSFEWASGGLNALFATRSNLLSPAFRTMLNDMLRFNQESQAFLDNLKTDSSLASLTMKEYLTKNNYSDYFSNWYLIPQVAAVWSASTDDVLNFPAATFIQFCANHSLVQVLGRPIWRTVSRRSKEYVQRIIGNLVPDRSEIRLGTTITSVTRFTDPSNGLTRIRIQDNLQNSMEYDQVIFGCHPDEALTLLTDATEQERSILQNFRYQASVSYLHTDDTLMPKRRQCWASWNYMGKGQEQVLTDNVMEPCCVSYWLNKLQNLPSNVPEYFVTLNPASNKLPRPETIIRTFQYSHPQYTLAAIEAQKAIDKIQGNLSTWFVGAYLGYGFHEDGLTSGLRVANRLTGISPPWWDKEYYTIRDQSTTTHGTVNNEGTQDNAVTIVDTASNPPNPAELYKEIQAKKASGGPYWEDNLGNGGPVGIATRKVVQLLHETRTAHHPGQSVTPAASVGTVLKNIRLHSRMVPAAHLADNASVSTDPEHYKGTNTTGDITGYVLEYPDDVLDAYRKYVGIPTVRTKSSGKNRKPFSSMDNLSSNSSTNRATNRDPTGTNSSEMDTEDTGSEASGSNGSDTDERNSTENNSIDTEPRIITSPSRSRAGGINGTVTNKLNPSTILIDIPEGKELTPDLLRYLHAKRSFKDPKVGAAIVKLWSHLYSSVSSGNGQRFKLTVGDCMRRPGLIGGYTGQQTPLETPLAYSGTLPFLWDSLKTTALQMVAAPVLSFLRSSIIQGCILLRSPDGQEQIFGNPSATYPLRSRIRVHSWNFFARVAAEADLGLARSFIAGEWSTDDLTALFNIFIANRDSSALSTSSMWTAWIGITINYLSFAIQMDNSIAGSRKNIHAHYDLSNDLFASFLDTRTMMYSCGFFLPERRIIVERDNTCATVPNTIIQDTERCTSEQANLIALNSYNVPLQAPSVQCTEQNNRLVQQGKKVTRQVKKPYIQLPADTADNKQPSPKERVELLFKGSLEDAQIRKLDHLIARAHVQKTDRVLDLGFGWGGLSIRLAETIGCRVHGITLSKEQHDLALERVKARGLDHLITFEIIDYRDFAANHPGEFDKIISIEMIEAVGHNYFGNFMEALDRLLAPHGIIVIQAITMPEARYEEYIRTTDFINTIIFPGGCCPSIAALTDAMMKKTHLVLNSVDQFNLHYGETLRRWRANFNAVLDDIVRPLGFDNDFIRTWNYYFTYCEAGFSTQTLGLQVLTFTRPNNIAFITGKNSGKVADPLGNLVNSSEDTPIVIPAGTF